ncbi:MAG TPA: hypothetical protein ENJ09_07745 [Planctomycetes bacterium]|nr:hypothetical protein [Planctomycetota bacterium]
MKGFVRKLLGRSRLRTAKRNLTRDPSPQSYAAAVQECVRAGSLADALALCEEGLLKFPGNPLLTQLHDRTQHAVREDRLLALRAELEEAPRAALWKEMCELLHDLGQLRKAEEFAREWVQREDGGEARLMLARLRVDRFYEDRGRSLGSAAIEALEDARSVLPGDLRPLRLHAALLARIGAFAEARDLVKKMLEIAPGDLELEGRFRSYSDKAEGAPDLDRALVAVERTGQFVDEHEEVAKAPERGFSGIRPVLRELTETEGIHASLYLRGATVLVQGPHGATAERMARGVRTILSTGRTASRRLGLGPVQDIQLEGDFGVLTIAPGDADAGAVWSTGLLDESHRVTLLSLAGRGTAGAESTEVES